MLLVQILNVYCGDCVVEFNLEKLLLLFGRSNLNLRTSRLKVCVLGVLGVLHHLHILLKKKWLLILEVEEKECVLC